MSTRSALPSLLLLCLLGACASDPAPAPTAETEASDESPAFTLPDGFDHALEQYIAGWGRHWPTFRVHGVTSVSRAGEALHRHAWGLKTLTDGTPHDPADAFEIGTLSVHLTHAAVLAMVAKGSIDLDAAAADYAPGLGLPTSITVEHLLTMTSGIGNFTESLVYERVLKKYPAEPASLVESFAKDPLEFAPGTDFAPSLSNTVVLGLILERAYGASYEEAVEALVLTPLKMSNTRYGRVEGASVGLSFHEDEFLVPALENDPRALSASGGWTSTSSDLNALYAGLLGDFLPTSLKRRMLGDNALERPYGFVPRTVAGRDALTWIGRIDGHEHGLVILPGDGVVVLHLANSEVAPGPDIAEAVTGLAYDLPAYPREEARATPIDVASLAGYAGAWSLTASDRDLLLEATDPETARSLMVVKTAFVPDDGLRLHIPGRPVKRMHATGSLAFFFKDRPQSTARIVRTTGAPKLVLERGGGSLHYVYQGPATSG